MRHVMCTRGTEGFSVLPAAGCHGRLAVIVAAVASIIATFLGHFDIIALVVPTSVASVRIATRLTVLAASVALLDTSLLGSGDLITVIVTTIMGND